MTTTAPATTVSAPALETMKGLPNWVLWKKETRRGKVTKVPYNPYNGRKAASDDPKTWATYERVKETLERCPDDYDGIGFMFAGSLIVGADLDHCVDENGNIDDWALEFLQRYPTYAEFSPNDGIHIFGYGELPEHKGRKFGLKGKRHEGAAIEIYDSGRFFTYTGRNVPGTPTTINSIQESLDALISELSAKPERKAKSQQQATATTSDLSDNELLDIAAKAKNGTKFSALWRGDISGYASPSEADQALCNLLAFYTGKDVQRIDRLFRRSGLYREEKWDRNARAGETYGQGTIARAIATTTEVFHPHSKQHEGREETASNLAEMGTSSSEVGTSSSAERSKQSNVKDLATIAGWFYEKYREEVIYNRHNQAWYLWPDTKRNWENLQDTEGQKQSCHSIDERLMQLLEEYGIPVKGSSQLDCIIRLARVKCEGEMRSREGCLNFRNGTLDIATMTLDKHCKEDYLTYCLPYDYADGSHPTIDRVLKEIIPDLYAQQAFKAHIGLGLMGDVDLHYALLIFGVPRSGKTTLLALANMASGIPEKQFAGDSLFSTDLEGKRSRFKWNTGKVVCIDELSVEALRNEGIFKDMSAHSGVEMRGIGRDEHRENQWKPKILMATNEKPRYKDTSGAIRERLIPIQVPNRREEDARNLRLLAEMKPELGAFVHTCIIYALALLERGYYPKSAAMKAILGEMSEAGDPLKAFIADECVLEVKKFIPTGTIYEKYKAYCHEGGHFPMAKNNMVTCLTEMGKGITCARSRDGSITGEVQRGLKGIRLRTAGEKAVEDETRYQSDPLLIDPNRTVNACERTKDVCHEMRSHGNASSEANPTPIVNAVNAKASVIAYSSPSDIDSIHDETITIYSNIERDAAQRSHDGIETPVESSEAVNTSRDTHSSVRTQRSHIYIGGSPPANELASSVQVLVMGEEEAFSTNHTDHHSFAYGQWVDCKYGYGLVVHSSEFRVDVDILGKVHSLRGSEIDTIKPRN